MGTKLIALNHSTEPIYQRATTLTWAVDNIARTKVALTELLSNLETSHKVGDRWGRGEGAEWFTCGRAGRFWSQTCCQTWRRRTRWVMDGRG